jgi:hypothetical protein
MNITCNARPDAAPISSGAPDGLDILVDAADAVRELGFKPIRAWVPDETKRNETNGAQRTRRHREKAEQQGLKQLSVTLPVELHPLVKTLAARTKAGEPPATVLAELMPMPGLPGSESTTPKSADSLPQLERLPAWRRWLLRWLLPRDQQLMPVVGPQTYEASVACPE